jgi:hypothetical protein
MNANELANIADGLSIEIPIREWVDNEPKNVMTDIATMLRQLQTERDFLFKAHSHEMMRADKLAIELEQALVVINSVANGYIELSHDKVLLQNREQIKWCKDFLESINVENA